MIALELLLVKIITRVLRLLTRLGHIVEYEREVYRAIAQMVWNSGAPDARKFRKVEKTVRFCRNAACLTPHLPADTVMNLEKLRLNLLSLEGRDELFQASGRDPDRFL